MKYYEDLQSIGKSDKDLFEFILSAITEYKSTDMYKDACTAYEYFRKRNVTIIEYQKLLYTITGEAVPDNYSANYKFTNAFFPIFVKQENSYLLGDGVTFNNDATKDALGGDMFDNKLFKAGESALWGAVSYLFFNMDHINVFKSTEFVPLNGLEDGALHAGIRFWQIDKTKPLRATLYEEDGYTEFIWDVQGKTGNNEARILNPKESYIKTVSISEIDGTEILEGKNYPGFPIVPLWGNEEHQSELVGLREKIDGYDLIQSGLCNTIDEASLVYWIIQNAGGMDEVDLSKFLDQIKRVHAAVVEDDGAKAESHTLDIPYNAHMTALQDLRDSLYRDAMALDTDKLSAGNITATAIEASYENLELKCDGYETCVTEAINALLSLANIEDSPTYHRRKSTNQPEVTQMVLSAGSVLDDETILKHLPFLNIDEIDEILQRKDTEEAERFADTGNTGEGEDEEITDSDIDDAVDTAEDVKGQPLNGIQMQSLLLVMEKFADGRLNENQAINMIATAIGVSKDKAREIVQGL